MLCASQQGSLKVKIMRVATPTDNGQQKVQPASWSTAMNNSYQHSNSLPLSFGPPPTESPTLSVTSSMLLGAPPAAGPVFGTENSLAGGGIYQKPPTMEVNTRTFEWLANERKPRARSGSLPSAYVDPSLYYYSNANNDNQFQSKESFY